MPGKQPTTLWYVLNSLLQMAQGYSSGPTALGTEPEDSWECSVKTAGYLQESRELLELWRLVCLFVFSPNMPSPENRSSWEGHSHHSLRVTRKDKHGDGKEVQ